MAALREHPAQGNKHIARRPAKQGALVSLSKPQAHGTISTLSNWSEQDFGSFSVSKLYREIASLSRGSHEKSPTLKTHLSSIEDVKSSVLTCLSHMKHPRTFHNEKKTLTRGEKNIIEGICSNRGSINARVSFRKPQPRIKNKQESSSFGNFGKESPGFVMPMLKGEQINGKSLLADGLTHFVKPNLALISDPVINVGNSSRHLSNSPDSVNLAACSKVNYLPSSPSDSTRPFCQQECQDNNNKTKVEMKLKSTEDFRDDTSQTSSNAQYHLEDSRNHDKSILELHDGLQTHLRTQSSRKQVVKDSSSMYIKSTPRDLLTFSFQSTKTFPLHVQNTKLKRQTKHALQPISVIKETRLNAESSQDCGISCAGKIIDEDEDKTKSCRINSKMQVRIYLPIAEPETTLERGVSTPASARKFFLTKERPLSPTEFKARYKGKSAVDVNQMFHEQQRSRTLKEVC